MLSKFIDKKKTNEQKQEVFKYKGYSIPIDLVNLTGGGVDTWDEISKEHSRQHAKYAPIALDNNVLEVGCGVGRDAITLTEQLSSKGSYTGIDIIKPSIEWCQSNITKKHPNFKFYFLDIQSQIHNPGGKIKATIVTLPVKSNSKDRIILHSVFTHMFKKDIIHYLKEFSRALKPDGKVFASFFVLDSEASTLIKGKSTNQFGTVSLTFRHDYGDGCFINDEIYPEGAVGYTPKALREIISKGNMMLDQPIHYGFWSGRKGATDGQDIVVLKPSSEPSLSVSERIKSIIKRTTNSQKA